MRELTTWIMSDPDASQFLSGKPDPWGMHVDSFYKTSVYPYPINSFVAQDASGPPVDPGTGLPYDPQGTHRDYNRLKGFEWNPIQAGLDAVARNLVLQTPTCILQNYEAPAGHAKCGPQNLGSRSLIAIMDTGRAAAFSFPTAALANGTGAFVTPTAPSMASAALDYVTDPKTGTQSLPWGVGHTGYAGDTAAYPLTVPNYAMAPTSGVSSVKATDIAEFLTAVTDSRSGQLPGNEPGQLAPGYVGDTPAQAGQAGTAIARIRAGAVPGGPTTVTATGPVTGQPSTSGNVVVTPVTVSKNGTASVSYITSTIGSGGGANGGTGPGGSGGSSSKGAAGAAGSGGPTHSLSGSTAAAALGSVSADTAGFGRLILPILLIAGLVLVAAGPAALLLTSGGAGVGLGLCAELPRAGSGGERVSTADVGADLADSLFGPPPGNPGYGPQPGPAAEDRPIRIIPGVSRGDRVFRIAFRAAGLSVFAIMGLIALFLLTRGAQALHATGWSFLTEQRGRRPPTGSASARCCRTGSSSRSSRW